MGGKEWSKREWLYKNGRVETDLSSFSNQLDDFLDSTELRVSLILLRNIYSKRVLPIHTLVGSELVRHSV